MKNKKILVVDDEKHMRKLMEYNLKKEGYLVDVARNGVEALQKVAENKPDIILLDIKMPVMDGYETCKQLRKNPKTCKTPVIVVSILADTKDTLALKGNSYILKPFDSGYLLREVSRLLGEKRKGN